MKIDSVSYAVASKVVKNFAMSVSRIRGFSAADGWLHVFDLKAVPTSGAGVVPKRSYPIYANAPFDVMLADEPLDFSNGCVCAMSSVEGAYTALASTMDLYVTGTSHIDDTDWTIAGDYTTAAETLQVWADAAGPKQLVRIEASDETSAIGPLYLQIHAGDAPATEKIVHVIDIAAGAVIDVFFGFGLSVEKTSAGVNYNGCTLALSSTRNTYTALGANIDYLRATYKNA